MAQVVTRPMPGARGCALHPCAGAAEPFSTHRALRIFFEVHAAQVSDGAAVRIGAVVPLQVADPQHQLRPRWRPMGSLESPELVAGPR